MPVENAAAETVLAETLGKIRILTLNRPGKLNAVTFEMQRRLLERLDQIADDTEARALVLTGSGRAFCAGGDHELVRQLATGEFKQLAELAHDYNGVARRLLGLSIPVIAAIPGLAVGFGAGLVSLCDMVVIGEDAYIADPHVPLGLTADPMVQIMWPRILSRTVATELLLTGRKVPAAEALSLGLANRVCPTGQERSTALELAQFFAALPANGIATTKRAMNAELGDEIAKRHERLSAALRSDLAAPAISKKNPTARQRG